MSQTALILGQKKNSQELRTTLRLTRSVISSAVQIVAYIVFDGRQTNSSLTSTYTKSTLNQSPRTKAPRQVFLVRKCADTIATPGCVTFEPKNRVPRSKYQHEHDLSCCVKESWRSDNLSHTRQFFWSMTTDLGASYCFILSTNSGRHGGSKSPFESPVLS